MVWVEAVRDIGPRNMVSHFGLRENRGTYAVPVSETLHSFHHEMLCALSLCVRVKMVRGILMRISKGEDAERGIRTRTASSGHCVSTRCTATRYGTRCWRCTG